MKQLRFFSARQILVGLIVFVLSSCGSDPVPVPTVNFIAEATGYEVAITVESTDASTFEWQYGDGETSTESGNHTHTYAKSGDYTIIATATNESGSATKNVIVSIAASKTELLAGTSASGKIWILDAESSTNLQKIAADLPLWTGLPAGALAAFGLEVEYDNKYTFKPTGGYGVDGVNGAVLTGLLFTLVNELDVIVEPTSGGSGMTGAAFAAVNNGEYTLHENTDLTMTVANEDYPLGTNDGGVTEVTFPNANYLTFSEGSFLGIRDFTTTVLIRSITKDKMDVTIFLSTLDPSTYPLTLGLPAIAISTSMKVKP